MIKTNSFDVNNLNKKPKMLMCFICGREFSTASLEIHMNQCKVKAENEKGTQISIPDEVLTLLSTIKQKKNLSSEQIESFNQTSNELYTNTSLVGCHMCGRRFQSDRLEIHLRSCKGPDKHMQKKFNQNSKSPGKNNTGNSNDLFLKKLEQELEKEGNTKNSSITTNNSKHKKNASMEMNTGSGKDSTKSSTITTTSGSPKVVSKGKIQISNTPNKTGSDSTKLFEEKLKGALGGSDGKISTTSSKTGGGGGGNSSTFKDTRPQFLVCYLCGREFGKTSLSIHLSSCMEKYISERQNKNPKEKVHIHPVPEELEELLLKINDGEEVTRDEINHCNEVSNEIYKEYTMKECVGCHRKFLPDRLEVHLKSCKAAGVSGASDTGKVPNMNSRPRLLMCPLCGREYGSLSLPIHLKSCRDKFIREQTLLPKDKRRDPDKILKKYEESNAKLQSSGTYDIEKLNAETFDTFNTDALVPCEKCGRTFLPDRLLVHQRSCLKEKKK